MTDELSSFYCDAEVFCARHKHLQHKNLSTIIFGAFVKNGEQEYNF